MALKWKGSTAVREAPQSPERVRSAAGLTVTRTFYGPFLALVAAEPQIGAEMEGTPGVTVSSVRTVPQAAGPDGPGTMVVVATDEGGTGEVVDDTSPASYEVEWSLLEKPLESHPRYQAAGAKPLTIADLVDLDNWKAETDRAKKSAYQYVDSSGATISLSANATDFAAHVIRGITNYVVPAPVVRRSFRSSSLPASTSQGTKENPPGASGYPGGYQWLKTADRAVRQGGRGKWERTEEWTGSDEWVDTLYT